uniref:Putative secreted protein n=1 Tax=Anopheles marajoara TaxID=58244 RepID=A0A2M4C7Z2_9DIPT
MLFLAIEMRGVGDGGGVAFGFKCFLFVCFCWQSSNCCCCCCVLYVGICERSQASPAARQPIITIDVIHVERRWISNQIIHRASQVPCAHGYKLNACYQQSFSNCRLIRN